MGTGIALSVTVALLYALCTLVWLSASGPFLGFMKSQFHGLDFKPLLTSAPDGPPGFAQRQPPQQPPALAGFSATVAASTGTGV